MSTAEPGTNGTTQAVTKTVPDAETIAKLKSQHGELRKHTADGAVVVIRRPSPEEWDAFMASGEQEIPAAKQKALIRLFKDVCVWPSAAELEVMLKERKGLGLTFGAKALEFGGVVAQVETEKY